MSKSLRNVISISLILTISYGLSLVWWRVWIYQGVVGPIPFLHWFIWSDGEGSYDLTALEMYIHILTLALGSFFYLVKAKKSKLKSEN